MVAILTSILTPAFAVALIAAGALVGAAVALLVPRREHGDVRAVREAIPSFRRSMSKVEIELARVRRYDHPLSVMVVRMPPSDIGDRHAQVFAGASNDARQHHIRRIVSLHVGAILYDCLRSSDLPTWDTEHDRYIVVLPEADRARAGQAADRLRRLVPSHVGASVAVGVAEFPSDGLALDDLVSLAAKRCAGRPEDATESAYAVAESTAPSEMVESNVVERDSMDRQAQSG